MATDLQKAFLTLVRLGIGAADQITPDCNDVFRSIDWDAMQVLANEQGLSAIAVDGLERLPAELKPSKPVLLQWIGETLQGESVYADQWRAACKMSRIFDTKGIRTYILKGFVVSECYPNPKHRVSVDLDCFLIETVQGSLSKVQHFDAWELGNRLMEQCGFDVDRSFYKNSTLYLPGLTVENHQFMTAVRGSKRLKKLERLLQSLICEDTELQRFEGTCMYRPPVVASALFLIEHAYAHFLHEGLTWRMVLDWMMFSKKHQQEIDWHALDALIDEYGFRKFYDSFLRLGKWLTGEFQEFDSLSIRDKRMMADIWAPLDLHEFHGVKGKIALAGNEIRASWKYKYFTPDTMIGDLFNRVKGFLFERNPRI